jgi:hypothetical protein
MRILINTKGLKRRRKILVEGRENVKNDDDTYKKGGEN